jgi:hypothetical protein
MNPQAQGAQTGEFNTPPSAPQTQAKVPTVQQENIPVIEEAGQVETPAPPKVEQITETQEKIEPQGNIPQDDSEINVKDIPF